MVLDNLQAIICCLYLEYIKHENYDGIIENLSERIEEAKRTGKRFRWERQPDGSYSGDIAVLFANNDPNMKAPDPEELKRKYSSMNGIEYDDYIEQDK